MARLMIKCPMTGQPVFTGMDLTPVSNGMEFTREAFDSSTLKDNSVSCPHCHQQHVWQKEDAYLEDE